MTVKVVVHAFRLGDVEDPVLYAAQPIREWEKSEAGQWVREHAIGHIEWFQGPSQQDYYGYQFRIVADLKEEDATFFSLKWGIK
jgi:hypothetical protein